MDILVTGSNGFVGRHVCARLIKAGHQVYGLSHQAPLHLNGLAGFHEKDLRQHFHLDESFDCVVHLAAYNITNVGDKDQERYQEINVQGTEHLLKGVIARRFVYLSTVKVYKNDGVPLLEGGPLAPAGLYEESKLQAEHLCQQLCPKDRLVILRSANIIGWGQAPKAVLPIFFQKAAKGEALELTVSPRSTVQFVDVHDVAEAIELSLNSQVHAGIFNIASEEQITIEGLARAVILLMQSSSELRIKENAQDASWPVIDCAKAQKQLGWMPKTSLLETLERYREEYERSKL